MFENCFCYDARARVTISLKGNATAEERNINNWSVEYQPYYNIYGGRVSGPFKGRIFAGNLEFNGFAYPMDNPDSSSRPYMIPVIVKYKGIAVATYKPSAEQPSPGTWG